METKNNGRALHRGTVEFVNGPVIKAAGMRDFGMREVVHVGPKKLMGEIIKMDGDNATIQVYEDTDGLKIYEDVAGTGEPLSIELGPGLIGSFFDGIGRPLDALLEHEGMYISPGTTVNMINRDKIWDVTPTAKVGDMVAGGMVLATIQETPLLVHKIMVPPNLAGEVTWISPSGKPSAGSDAAKIKDAFGREITIPIIQRWPVRTPRPYRERLLPNEPFVTGQRVIDGLFPLAKGGTACIPGGFGTGKTVTASYFDVHGAPVELTVSVAQGVVLHAGEYTAQAQFATEDEQNNYTLQNGQTAFTVSPKAITVNILPQSAVYSGAVPVPSQ